MRDDILPLAAFAGALWDASRLLDAEYTGAEAKPRWSELSEGHKIDFMGRTEHLVSPLLTAYAGTGTYDG